MSLRALVTGGSSGIGRATAELLASKGIDVGVLAHDALGVDDVVRGITEEGGSAFGLCVDLAIQQNVVGLYDRIEAERGPIDILVNVAGIGLQADVVETRIEDLNRLFAVNFFAAAILSGDAMKSMPSRGGGNIISVSSASARRALPGMSTYSSTKAALHAFSQALRIEGNDLGVHVTEVLPMSVKTPFFESAVNRSTMPYKSEGVALMTSTPEDVAACVWRAIRRPVAEIYTSRLARFVLALDAAIPSVFDKVLVSVRRKRLGR
jgi:short-subunit dehydrogenase